MSITRLSKYRVSLEKQASVPKQPKWTVSDTGNKMKNVTSASAFRIVNDPASKIDPNKIVAPKPNLRKGLVSAALAATMGYGAYKAIQDNNTEQDQKKVANEFDDVRKHLQNMQEKHRAMFSERKDNLQNLINDAKADLDSTAGDYADLKEKVKAHRAQFEEAQKRMSASDARINAMKTDNVVDMSGYKHHKKGLDFDAALNPNKGMHNDDLLSRIEQGFRDFNESSTTYNNRINEINTTRKMHEESFNNTMGKIHQMNAPKATMMRGRNLALGGLATAGLAAGAYGLHRMNQNNQNKDQK